MVRKARKNLPSPLFVKEGNSDAKGAEPLVVRERILVSVGNDPPLKKGDKGGF
jgi:hypothetical protein